MKRRKVLAALAGGVLWPLRAAAQPKRRAKIGYLISQGEIEPFATYFRQGLREFGYVEGRTIELEIRQGDDRQVLAAAAADFVRQKLDLIATVRTAATEAAMRATKEIPIVVTLVADAVALSLVKTLAKPGGNVTGVSANTALMASKTLELAREIVPMRSVAALYDATTRFGTLFARQVEQTGKTLGFAVQSIPAQGWRGAPEAVQAVARARPDAAIIQPSLGVAAAQGLGKAGIPAVCPNNDLAAGCILTYGADIPDMFRKGAGYVDRILKGARPGDLPVEEPSKFELTVNLRLAKSLGIAVPPAFLVRADRVLQ